MQFLKTANVAYVILGYLEAARREFDRLRQANSRLCRKHGLKGKRSR